MADRIDLVALRRAITVVFPSGAEFEVAPFRLEGVRLLRQWQAQPDQLETLLQLLRLAVPSATEEDLNDLSVEEDVPRILAAATGKIQLMEAALKNGLSGAAPVEVAPPTPPSTPTTTTSTA